MMNPKRRLGLVTLLLMRGMIGDAENTGVVEESRVEIRMLYDFEDARQVASLTRIHPEPEGQDVFMTERVSENGYPSGNHWLRIMFPDEGETPGIVMDRIPADWSRHHFLALDVYSGMDKPIALVVAVADEHAASKKSTPVDYAVSRHWFRRTLSVAGRRSLRVPLAELVAEDGRSLDLRSITRLAFFVAKEREKNLHWVFLDNIRLETHTPVSPGLAAVMPEPLQVTCTIECIGLMWPVKGDHNGNATATVRFREARSTAWKEILPLFRVRPLYDRSFQKYAGDYLRECLERNYLAGAIFGLKPATTYEVEAQLTDPDGGNAVERRSVTTRSVPTPDLGGREIHVYFDVGPSLAEAVAQAQPGDVFLVHAGTYLAPIRVDASGTPEKPIVIRPAGDGEVIVWSPIKPADPAGWTRAEGREYETDGFTLSGSSIRLHDITIRGCYIGVYCGTRRSPQAASDIAVTHCRMYGSFHGIFGKANDSYFADNMLKSWAKDRGIKGGEGIEIRGRRNVICYNTVSRFGDGASFYTWTGDCDVYGNDFMATTDDAFEFDFSEPLGRVWNNRFSFTGNNGISFQPYYGGPAYLIQNFIYNRSENCIKDRFGACGLVAVNNTFWGRTPVAMIQRAYLRNNLFINYWEKGAIRFHREDLDRGSLDSDFNGYNGWIEIGGSKAALSLQEFTAASGQDAHSVQVDTQACFQFPPTNTVGRMAAVGEMGGWWPPPDFSLKEGSPAIDAGVTVPNLAEDFVGRAPDLGALEYGRPPPHWGVRPLARTYVVNNE